MKSKAVQPYMIVPLDGWKNKNGTSRRSCTCGSWKDHWHRSTLISGDLECSVAGCGNRATLGAHIIHKVVLGEWIILACTSCNGMTTNFSLKQETLLVSANRELSCEA
jgi:hypothetical protein